VKLSLLPFANRPPVNSSGFNLLEMSIVLVIVALLLAGTLLPLGSMQESSKRHDTADTIDEVVEALYGFAQINSRLPCPATTTSNGAEAPIGGGVCTQQHGFVPSSTLGLDGAFNDDILLSDAWRSPYRYSVSSASTSAVTTVLGTRDNEVTADLRVCQDAACAGVIVDTAAAVVLSLGADWLTFDGADVDATENSGEVTTNGYKHANDNNFVSSQYIENDFDDLIVWVSSSILITKMIAAGLLP